MSSTDFDTVPKKTRDSLLAEGKLIVSKINHETIKNLEGWILHGRALPEPIKEFTIIINSDGGNPGLIIYFASFIRTLAPEVRLIGVTYGECGSAALALMQCCHERIAVRNTTFFIHNININPKGGCQTLTVEDVRHRIDSARKQEAELVSMQARRCNMPEKKWRSLAKKGQKYPGSEILTKDAKKLGLIDKIIDSYPIF